MFWPACKLEKTSGGEESGGEGKRGSGRVGVHRSGGAHVGRGLSQAQPMGCCLPVKPSLLSGIESLSLPLDQTGGQLTSWWCKQAELHTYTHTHTHTHIHTHTHTHTFDTISHTYSQKETQMLTDKV